MGKHRNKKWKRRKGPLSHWYASISSVSRKWVSLHPCPNLPLHLGQEGDYLRAPAPLPTRERQNSPRDWQSCSQFSAGLNSGPSEGRPTPLQHPSTLPTPQCAATGPRGPSQPQGWVLAGFPKAGDHSGAVWAGWVQSILGLAVEREALDPAAAHGLLTSQEGSHPANKADTGKKAELWEWEAPWAKPW